LEIAARRSMSDQRSAVFDASAGDKDGVDSLVALEHVRNVLSSSLSFLRSEQRHSLGAAD